MPSETTIKGATVFARSLDGVDTQVLGEGLEVARLHRQIERAIENDLAAYGLSARQIEILESLYHGEEGGSTPADLADEVGLTRSAMTGALDSLEKHGHTERAPHPSDRRMVVVTLTPAGRTFIEQHLPERYRKLCRVMTSLSSWERAMLLRAYKKVLDAVAADAREDGE